MARFRITPIDLHANQGRRIDVNQAVDAGRRSKWSFGACGSSIWLEEEFGGFNLSWLPLVDVILSYSSRRFHPRWRHRYRNAPWAGAAGERFPTPISHEPRGRRLVNCRAEANRNGKKRLDLIPIEEALGAHIAKCDGEIVAVRDAQHNTFIPDSTVTLQSAQGGVAERFIERWQREDPSGEDPNSRKT